MQNYQHYIDGAWCDAEDQQTIASINPTTEAIWATVPAAGAADVDRAVTAAARAMDTGAWATMTATARGEFLYRLATAVAEQAESLGAIETTDSGKLLQETQGQADYVADYYRYFAGLADKIEGAVLPIDKPMMQVSTHPQPIGVVAAVVPWNAQMFLTATKLAPALAAGNSVVLKASELAPAALFEFAKIIDAVGFPRGVVNIITGHGEPCGRALTSHPQIARVAFTGGAQAAARVVTNTAANFAHVSLELGGKSPIIVFADADIEGAVNGIIAGNFGASGQSCVAGSRVLIEAKIYDEVVAKLLERTRTIRLGDPCAPTTQMGPLCTQSQIKRAAHTIATAKEQGATVLCGGQSPPDLPRGYFFEPTIVACPDQSIATVQTELFGPVMSVLQFTHEEQAIALANDTRFGLAAGIFTENLARAHRVSDRLRCGIVWVNTYRVISPIAPFGGFGHSGYGREAGQATILDYTRSKTVWINTTDEPMANPFITR